MAQLISAVYGSTTYDVGIPELTDNVDIRRAFADYHYGPGNTAASSTTTGINYHLGLKAPLASPALTGVPTAPTASVGTNTTQVATTAYVQGELAGAGLNPFFLAGL